MGEHTGRVAVVTGASSGIGRAVATVLAEQGATVAVNGIDRDETGAVVAEIAAAGGSAVPLVADVSDAAAITDAVTGLARRFGRLDALVTSAGVQRYGTATTTDEATWDDVFRINVKGVFLATRACLPFLRSRGDAAIVVISSVQATATQTNVVAYTASKGALNAFTRAVAVDEAPHGVRVNAICPGSIDTPMLRASAALYSAAPAGIEDTLAAWGASHPLGRIGRPREVAEAAAFLAGPRASFITGAEIRVDGGLLAAVAAALPATGKENPAP
jgi:NAD(P)-dependent dehydrogenase (short-subunit alcohol dehydrogenase family)